MQAWIIGHWDHVWQFAAPGICNSIAVQWSGESSHAGKRIGANTDRSRSEEARGGSAEKLGITVSDAVRILLTRTANEGELPFALAMTPPLMMRGFAPRCGKRWTTCVPAFRTKTSKRTSPNGGQRVAHALDRVTRNRCGSSCGWSGPSLRRPTAMRSSTTSKRTARRPPSTVDDRIRAQVAGLARFPERGRLGRVEGTRELVIHRTPYIAAYPIVRDTVRILRVLHGAQQWPEDISDESE